MTIAIFIQASFDVFVDFMVWQLMLENTQMEIKYIRLLDCFQASPIILVQNELLTSIVTNRLPLHELLDTIELQRISRHSLRTLFSCRFRNISLYMLSRELSSCTSIWNIRESSMSFLKSACIVRNAVRLSSARGNFLMSNGSMGTFGAGIGASYELNKCTMFADGSDAFADLFTVAIHLPDEVYLKQLRSHASDASLCVFRMLVMFINSVQ